MPVNQSRDKSLQSCSALKKDRFTLTQTPTVTQQTQVPGRRMLRRKVPPRRVVDWPLDDPLAQQRVHTRRVQALCGILRVQVRTRQRHREAVTVFSAWLRAIGQSPSNDEETATWARSGSRRLGRCNQWVSTSAAKTSAFSSSLGAAAHLEAGGTSVASPSSHRSPCFCPPRDRPGVGRARSCPVHRRRFWRAPAYCVWKR